ncbi:hypothetical protein [Hahella ganghwensis]|uniref:hypothetical protein n=1 Tax=Hahella ganghwensis TaxID=286420 RepID=UPI0012FB2801|nr:hypothetical protein [Hahella ganghwensis]
MKTLNRILGLSLFTAASFTHGLPMTEDPVKAAVNIDDNELILDSQYNSVTTYDSSRTIATTGADIDRVTTYNESRFEANPGSKISYLSAEDQSAITAETGSDFAHLTGLKQSTINIFGGEISWLRLYDQSVANITFADDLSWLILNDDAQVNIYGKEFSYTGGHLSGVWENGEAFSFWAYEETGQGPSASSALPEGITLHFVDGPASMALLGTGLLLLGRFRHGKNQ